MSERHEVKRASKIIADTLSALLTKQPYTDACTLADVLGNVDGPQNDIASSDKWISENAYFRWESEGRPANRDQQHWHDAERESFASASIRASRGFVTLYLLSAAGNFSGASYGLSPGARNFAIQLRFASWVNDQSWR